MRWKFLFIVGLGVGYILGARAGRPRYEQIKAKATEAWEDPRVQKVVTDTQDFVKETAPIVQDKVVAGTKAAVAGAQDAAQKASVVAKDVSGKIAKTTKEASKSAKKVSRKVAKTAQKASSTVAQTAKDVRDRIIDRGEDVVENVIVAAGTARDKALDVESDDDK